MTFKEAFKFPLHGDYGIIFTANGNRAFDFPMKMLHPNAFALSEESSVNVVRIINGEEGKPKTKLNLSYDPSKTMIFIEVDNVKREFICIRGWGYLTGTGGLKLSSDVAIRMQDEFANYIIEMLTKE